MDYPTNILQILGGQEYECLFNECFFPKVDIIPDCNSDMFGCTLDTDTIRQPTVAPDFQLEKNSISYINEISQGIFNDDLFSRVTAAFDTSRIHVESSSTSRSYGGVVLEVVTSVPHVNSPPNWLIKQATKKGIIVVDELAPVKKICDENNCSSDQSDSELSSESNDEVVKDPPIILTKDDSSHSPDPLRVVTYDYNGVNKDKDYASILELSDMSRPHTVAVMPHVPRMLQLGITVDYSYSYKFFVVGLHFSGHARNRFLLRDPTINYQVAGIDRDTLVTVKDNAFKTTQFVQADFFNYYKFAIVFTSKNIENKRTVAALRYSEQFVISQRDIQMIAILDSEAVFFLEGSPHGTQRDDSNFSSGSGEKISSTTKRKKKKT